MPKQIIYIEIAGGVCVNVTNIPKKVTVRVIDYDNDPTGKTFEDYKRQVETSS